LELVSESPRLLGVRVSQLATAIYGASPTRSQLVSVRRAVGKLREEGLVRTSRDPAYADSLRTYQRRGRKSEWCTAKGERWQLRSHPGRCFHCESGLPRHDDGDGPYHVPLVTVRGINEMWVCRPLSEATDEEKAAIAAQLAETEGQK
jgi:hypothetical protein